MLPRYSVVQKSFGLSQLEDLTLRRSWDIQNLAARAGWSGSGYQALLLNISQILHVMIQSEAMRGGIEVGAILKDLPFLRIEALLKLGSEFETWQVEGTPEQDHAFWPLLYGTYDSVRLKIAPVLGCTAAEAARELVVYSSADIVRLPNDERHTRRSNQSPMFVLDAHDLASRVAAICGPRLFKAVAN